MLTRIKKVLFIAVSGVLLLSWCGTILAVFAIVQEFVPSVPGRGIIYILMISATGLATYFPIACVFDLPPFRKHRTGSRIAQAVMLAVLFLNLFEGALFGPGAKIRRSVQQFRTCEKCDFELAGINPVLDKLTDHDIAKRFGEGCRFAGKIGAITNKTIIRTYYFPKQKATAVFTFGADDHITGIQLKSDESLDARCWEGCAPTSWDWRHSKPMSLSRAACPHGWNNPGDYPAKTALKNLSTGSNVSLGASENEVIRAYGVPLSQRDLPGGGHELFYGRPLSFEHFSTSAAMTFWFQQGKLSDVHVEVPEELIEGEKQRSPSSGSTAPLSTSADWLNLAILTPFFWLLVPAV
jgi:hypothetical protein